MKPEQKTLAKLVDFLKGLPEIFSSKLHYAQFLNFRHVRRCKITGADISDQRKDSVFISEKKVGYLEAHRVRNKDSNPRNHLRYRLEKLLNEPSLFDQKKYIKLTPEQKKELEYWKGTEYEVEL